jgi:hypothetical protein
VKPRRVLFVGAVIALVVAAIAAGNATASSSNAAPQATVAAAIDPAHPSSTVWFCPGGPPTITPGDGHVVFANTGTAPAQVDVTVLPDKGSPTHVSYSVPASSVLVKPRLQIGAVGALTVETFGGRVVVEEDIDGKAGVESTPCATQASTQWFFAAGSTPRGIQQWLVLDNPYASDARVNIKLRTSDGVHEPQQLQALDVPRRSRIVVPVHTLVVREDRVAVEVDADLGRVVAEQTLVFTTDAGTPGVATTLGALAAGDHWLFAGGNTLEGASGIVAIANVGTDNAQVDVQAIPSYGKPPIAPTQLMVAQDDVVWVQLGGCAGSNSCVPVPSDQAFALDVHSEHGVAIVAQTLTRFTARSVELGATSIMGVPEPASTWLFARSIVDSERTTTLALFNPLAQSATVNVNLVHDGRVDMVNALQNVTVPAGARVTLVVVAPSRRPPNDQAAIVVTSTSQVIAERSMLGATDASATVGVPAG